MWKVQFISVYHYLRRQVDCSLNSLGLVYQKKWIETSGFSLSKIGSLLFLKLILWFQGLVLSISIVLPNPNPNPSFMVLIDIFHRAERQQWMMIIPPSDRSNCFGIHQCQSCISNITNIYILYVYIYTYIYILYMHIYIYMSLCFLSVYKIPAEPNSLTGFPGCFDTPLHLQRQRFRVKGRDPAPKNCWNWWMGQVHPRSLT